MPKYYLLTTPKGLRSLQARYPPHTIQGPDGFISSELVFRDALAAHAIQAILCQLAQAAARAHQEGHQATGRITRQTLADLSGALAKAQAWR